MSPPTWASISVLRQVWLQDDSPSPDSRLEGAFQAVTEDLVDAVTADGRDRLAAGQQELRLLLASVTARTQEPDVPPEVSPAFSVGRLVGLLDVAEDAVRRVVVGVMEAEFAAPLQDDASVRVLLALHEKAGALATSSELVARSGLDKAEMSRRLSILESRGLVSSRRLGKYRLSRLTLTGTAIASRRAKKADALPAVVSRYLRLVG